MPLITQDGSVQPALKELLLCISGFDCDGKPLQEVNVFMQENWMKAKDGVVRAELKGKFPSPLEAELLERVGISGELPIKDDPDRQGFIFLGASLKAVVRRMHYMHINREKIGICPTIMLGSERPLFMKDEGPEAVPGILKEIGAKFDPSWLSRRNNWPKTESEMISFVMWMTTNLSNFVVVSTPLKDGGKSPNTVDTVNEWFRRNLTIHGKYTLISSQPFCHGQRMAVERALREKGANVSVDVCGPAAPNTLSLDVLLDNIAKLFWEECRQETKTL